MAYPGDFLNKTSCYQRMNELVIKVFLPQISEHRPNKIIILSIFIEELFTRLGIASILIFNDGIGSRCK